MNEKFSFLCLIAFISIWEELKKRKTFKIFDIAEGEMNNLFNPRIKFLRNHAMLKKFN